MFGTVHAPLFNPIIAAKEFVTVDHIGEGRFGINLVVGWNEGEFEMFGVSQKEHDARYDFAQEWLDVIKRAWTEHDDFDFAGQYLKLKGVRAFPKPYGDTRPIIMNAGRSGVGQAFALKNCDAFFTATVEFAALDRGQRQEGRGDQERRPRERPRDRRLHGRPGGVPGDPEGGGRLLPPRRARQRRLGRGRADDGAQEHHAADRDREIYAQQQQYFAGKGIGGYPFIGTPDRVAEELANIARAGMRGIAVSFVNYLNEMPYFCDEVLPRLARLGIRQPH